MIMYLFFYQVIIIMEQYGLYANAQQLKIIGAEMELTRIGVCIVNGGEKMSFFGG